MNVLTRRCLLGRWRLRHFCELASCVEVAITKCGVDSENFSIANTSNRATLRNLRAIYNERDIDRHEFVGSGKRQILCRCTNEVALRNGFKCADARAETRATKQERTARRDANIDRHFKFCGLADAI